MSEYFAKVIVDAAPRYGVSEERLPASSQPTCRGGCFGPSDYQPARSHSYPISLRNSNPQRTADTRPSAYASLLARRR